MKNRNLGHYIFVVGILSWGVPMFVAMSLFSAIRSGDSTLLQIAIGIPLWAAAGASFGFIMWMLQGRNDRAANETAGDETVAIPEGTYAISLRTYRNLLIFCSVGFIGFLILMIAVKLWFGIALFGFFLLLSLVYLPLCWGFIDVNRERIRHSCGYGTFQIRWDDVTHVEIDPGESTLAFCGDGKRLPIPGSGGWTGPESREFETVIHGEIQARGLEIRERRRAAYMPPWNVKVAV